MVDIVNFNKTDVTARSTTNTSSTEITQYTVAWSDLTTAGFAASDDVIVIVKLHLSNNDNATNSVAEFRKGTTFAGASTLVSMRSESASATAAEGAREQIWMDRLTLTTNENFYIGLNTITANTASTNDFTILFMKLGDLDADDFRYLDETDSGSAPDTPTDGPSVTLPASGGDDWLVIATSDWLIDVTASSLLFNLDLGGSTVMSQSIEGEDASETLSFGAIGYLAAAANSAVCKLVYQGESAAGNDYVRGAIFALRLNAFTDHNGATSSTNTASGTVADTYVPTNTVSFSLGTTGDCCFFAQTLSDVVGNTVDKPYHRVQSDGTDIISGLGQGYTSSAYDDADAFASSSFGVASLTSGTLTIDVDSAKKGTNDFDYIDHALVIFSMELAGTGGSPLVLYTVPGLSVTNP